jgi:hypothetical protein
MNHFLDFVIVALGYLVRWRTWLCVIVALAIAYIIWLCGVAVMSSSATLLAAGLVGLVLGLCWDARAG